MRRSSLLPRPLALALVSAVLLPGCSNQPETPTGITAFTPPPADAAIVFTSDAWSSRPSGQREMYTVNEDGGSPTRVSSCNTESSKCSYVEAVPAPDGQRFAVRKVTTDTNGDGRLSEADGEALFLTDPSRRVEGRIEVRVSSPTPPGYTVVTRVSGITWSPSGQLLVLSANGEGSQEDLYRTVPRPDPTAAETGNLSLSADLRERRPCIDPSGSVAVYERIDAARKGEIWVFSSRLLQSRITSGGAAGEALAGTPYVVGSDADPDYSPDGRSIVFRRLTSTGGGGLGTWDVLVVRTDGSGLAPVASGSLHRGSPDWGPKGIVFAESDGTGSRLVLVQPDGSGRRVLSTLGAGFEIAHPRWIRAQ